MVHWKIILMNLLTFSSWLLLNTVLYIRMLFPLIININLVNLFSFLFIIFGKKKPDKKQVKCSMQDITKAQTNFDIYMIMCFI
jgi:hypothetical protein